VSTIAALPRLRTMRDWLIRGVAEIPATVHAKLLGAFLAMVVLLLTLNRRAEELVRLHRDRKRLELLVALRAI
jgi:hypothetical protein